MTILCECDCTYGSPISKTAYLSAVIIGIIRLLASLSLTYLLVRFKRRSMYLASSCGTILSLMAFSTILMLSDHMIDWNTGLSQDVLTVLSLISACFIVLSVNLGVQPMPLLMSSELYPSEHRAFCKVLNQLHIKRKKIFKYIDG